MKTYNSQIQNYPKTYLQSSYQFDAQNSQQVYYNKDQQQLQQQRALQQQPQSSQQQQQQLYILQQKKNQGNLTDPRPGVPQQQNNSKTQLSMNYSYQQQNQNQENSISPQSFQKQQLNGQHMDTSPIRNGKVLNLKQVQDNGQTYSMSKSPMQATPQSNAKMMNRQNSQNSINQFGSVQMKSEMELIKDENLNLKAQRKIDQEELDFWKKKCEEFQVRIQKEMRTNFNLREQQSTQASSSKLRDSTPSRLNSSVSSIGTNQPKQQYDEKLIKEYEREARLKDQQIEQIKKEMATQTQQFEHLHRIYEEQRTLNGKLQIQIMDNGEDMAKLKERFQRLEKKFTERSALKPSSSLSLSPQKRVQFGQKSNIKSVHQVEKYIQEQQCLNHTPSPSPDHDEIQDTLNCKYERLMDSIDPNSPLKIKRQKEQEKLKQQQQQEKENQISKFDEYEEKLKNQKEKRAKLEDEFKQRDSFTTSEDRRSRYNYGAHNRTNTTGNTNGSGINQPPSFNINQSKIVNDRIKAQQQLLNNKNQNQENDYQQAKKVGNSSTRQEENPFKNNNNSNNKGQYTNYKPQFTHQRQASDGYASDRLNVFNDSGKKSSHQYGKQSSLQQDYINGLLDEQNIKNSMLLVQSKKQLIQNDTKPKYTFTSPYKSYLEEINNRKE